MFYLVFTESFFLPQLPGIFIEEIAETVEGRGEIPAMEILTIEEANPGNVPIPSHFTPIPILDLDKEFATSFNTHFSTHNILAGYTNSLYKKTQHLQFYPRNF